MIVSVPYFSGITLAPTITGMIGTPISEGGIIINYHKIIDKLMCVWMWYRACSYTYIIIANVHDCACNNNAATLTTIHIHIPHPTYDQEPQLPSS